MIETDNSRAQITQNTFSQNKTEDEQICQKEEKSIYRNEIETTGGENQDNQQNSESQHRKSTQELQDTESNDLFVKKKSQPPKNHLRLLIQQYLEKGMEVPDPESQQLKDEQRVILQAFIERKQGTYIQTPQPYQQLNNDENNQSFGNSSSESMNDQETQREKTMGVLVKEDHDQKENNILVIPPNQIRKRQEEMQKFIFKRSFKYAEKRFFEQKPAKKRTLKRDKDYHKFYDYYFGENSKKSNIEICNYYHPDQKTNKQSKKDLQLRSSGQKSFNQAYINIILSSFKFREITKQYIEREAKNQITKDRDKKIQKFLDYCENKIKDLKDSFSKLRNNIKTCTDYVAQGVKFYILCDSKCQIPWSNQEISECIKYAGNSIEEYS